MKFNSFQQQIFLLIIIFIATTGTTISFSIFAPLFLHPDTNSIISPDWNHEVRSILLGMLIASYPLGQFLGSSLLGRISDHHGRRPAMIYTLFGASIGYLLTGISFYEKSLVLLLLSSFVTGFLEGNIAIARSSAGDISGVSSKHKNFGNISAAGTLGRLVGPILGGFLVDSKIVSWFNYEIPFYFSSILLLVIAILCLIFFEETHSLEKRSIKIPLKEQYQIFSRIKKIGHTSALKSYLLIWFIVATAVDIFILFVPAYLTVKWQLSPIEIGFYHSMLCIGYIIGCVYVVPYLATKIKTLTAIHIGLGIFIFSLAGILIPSKSYFLLPLYVICSLGVALILVNFFVYISDLSKQEHQGEVMGLTFGLRMLGDAGIGVGGGFLIAVAISLPIIFSIVFSLVALGLLMRERRVILNIEDFSQSAVT